MIWSMELYRFYAGLQPPEFLPNDISWLYPQQDKVVMEIVQQFLHKYYEDANPRTLLLGINPGRLGAGVTGVNFTAPKQLREVCRIEHPFKMKSELSAEFIYEMIDAFGGPEAFYKHYFIGSVCPLGFIKGGKNINYYDDKQLLETVEPFITSSLTRLLKLPFRKEVCICIGGEKNYKYLLKLNAEFNWFRQIVSVPHPRFIMQYKRKQKADYIRLYVQILQGSAA